MINEMQWGQFWQFSLVIDDVSGKLQEHISINK